MIQERSMADSWLSNTYLVGDEEGGTAVLIDAGGPVAPLLEAIDEHGLSLTHVLLTHHHHDHVAELGDVLERYPDVAVLAHPDEREAIMGVTDTIEPGDKLTIGGLEIEAIHTPGHTGGMLNFLVDGSDLYTGDTLFKGSVGGVRAPGSTSYEDLRGSIMDTLMSLPPETVIRPGHTEPTTVAAEWEGNAFIRVWRGVDPEGDEPCTALGEPATLVLLGDDYDGGHKAWVRWPDGRDDIVPGSKVQRG
jgi:glyoxylase-like metal-dependent hydrolase (beta-lactamase superfamily II)